MCAIDSVSLKQLFNLSTGEQALALIKCAHSKANSLKLSDGERRGERKGMLPLEGSPEDTLELLCAPMVDDKQLSVSVTASACTACKRG